MDDFDKVYLLTLAAEREKDTNEKGMTFIHLPARSDPIYIDVIKKVSQILVVPPSAVRRVLRRESSGEVYVFKDNEGALHAISQERVALVRADIDQYMADTHPAAPFEWHEAELSNVQERLGPAKILAPDLGSIYHRQGFSDVFASTVEVKSIMDDVPGWSNISFFMNEREHGRVCGTLLTDRKRGSLAPIVQDSSGAATVIAILAPDLQYTTDNTQESIVPFVGVLRPEMTPHETRRAIRRLQSRKKLKQLHKKVAQLTRQYSP